MISIDGIAIALKLELVFSAVSQPKSGAACRTIMQTDCRVEGGQFTNQEFEALDPKALRAICITHAYEHHVYGIPGMLGKIRRAYETGQDDIPGVHIYGPPGIHAEVLYSLTHFRRSQVPACASGPLIIKYIALPSSQRGDPSHVVVLSQIH